MVNSSSFCLRTSSQAFLLSIFSSALLSLSRCFMYTCRIPLTRLLVSVNYNSACPLCAMSLFPNTFSGDEKATWPLKAKLAVAVITLPFVALPTVCVCPHVSQLQTLSLRSNPQSPDPLLRLPLEVLMTLFVWGATLSSSHVQALFPAPDPSSLIVIALPLVGFSYDLRRRKTAELSLQVTVFGGREVLGQLWGEQRGQTPADLPLTQVLTCHAVLISTTIFKAIVSCYSFKN